MKILLALVLLSIGVAEAKSIPSLDNCKVTDRAKVRTGTMSVENTRLTGKAALIAANNLKSQNAEVETVTDILGVKRYEAIELRTLLDINPSEDPCEGTYQAVKSEICTVDAVNQTCETFCKVEWLGLDCR